MNLIFAELAKEKNPKSDCAQQSKQNHIISKSVQLCRYVSYIILAKAYRMKKKRQIKAQLHLFLMYLLE